MRDGVGIQQCTVHTKLKPKLYRHNKYLQPSNLDVEIVLIDACTSPSTVDVTRDEHCWRLIIAPQRDYRSHMSEGETHRTLPTLDPSLHPCQIS